MESHLNRPEEPHKKQNEPLRTLFLRPVTGDLDSRKVLRLQNAKVQINRSKYHF